MRMESGCCTIVEQFSRPCVICSLISLWSASELCFTSLKLLHLPYLYFFVHPWRCWVTSPYQTNTYLNWSDHSNPLSEIPQNFGFWMLRIVTVPGTYYGTICWFFSSKRFYSLAFTARKYSYWKLSLWLISWFISIISSFYRNLLRKISNSLKKFVINCEIWLLMQELKVCA